MTEQLSELLPQEDEGRPFASEDFKTELADVVADRVSKKNEVYLTVRQYNSLLTYVDTVKQLRKPKPPKKETKFERGFQIGMGICMTLLIALTIWVFGRDFGVATSSAVQLECTHCSCADANDNHASPFWHEVLTVELDKLIYTEGCLCECTVKATANKYKDAWSALTMPFNVSIAAPQ
jgi:hypothetical protein